MSYHQTKKSTLLKQAKANVFSRLGQIREHSVSPKMAHSKYSKKSKKDRLESAKLVISPIRGPSSRDFNKWKRVHMRKGKIQKQEYIWQEDPHAKAYI